MSCDDIRWMPGSFRKTPETLAAARLIGERITARQEELKITQQELADLVWVTPSLIRFLQRGTRLLRGPLLRRIEAALLWRSGTMAGWIEEELPDFAPCFKEIMYEYSPVRTRGTE